MGATVASWALAVACALVGCSACGGAGESRPASGPPATTTVAHAAEAHAAEAHHTAAPQGPPPALTLRAEPDGAGARWSLQNRDRARLRVASRVRLEREVGAGFEPFEALLSLRDDCARTPPACRELVPGAELWPPPWLGTAGTAQCACEGCAAAPAGRYRMVVEGCDGEYRVTGPPFALARD